jgi:hypothetical protein
VDLDSLPEIVLLLPCLVQVSSRGCENCCGAEWEEPYIPFCYTVRDIVSFLRYPFMAVAISVAIQPRCSAPTDHQPTCEVSAIS